MTREDVIRQIVARDLQKLNLSAEAVLRDAPHLHAAACDQFGTWDTALRYAGVNLQRLRAERRYSQERVLQQINRLCRAGYNLRAGHNQRRDPDLYAAARRHFGAWKRALRAAGIDLQRAGLGPERRRLDKQAIIAALQERHRAGRSLRCCDVSRDDRGLATAAKNAFSSWWRALVAAGVAPDIRPNCGRPSRWNKQLVIEAIRTQQQAGQRIRSTDQRALVAAARRYFGSWAEALSVAATDPDTHGG